MVLLPEREEGPLGAGPAQMPDYERLGVPQIQNWFRAATRKKGEEPAPAMAS